MEARIVMINVFVVCVSFPLICSGNEWRFIKDVSPYVNYANHLISERLPEQKIRPHRRHNSDGLSYVKVEITRH